MSIYLFSSSIIAINNELVVDQSLEYDYSGEVINKDEYSTTFKNSDGSNTAIMHSEPVRINKDGELTDIDTSFALRNDEFKTINTTTDITIPKDISKDNPIKINDNHYPITFFPVNLKSDVNSKDLDFDIAINAVAKENYDLVHDLYGKESEKLVSLIYNAFDDWRRNINIRTFYFFC